MALSFVVWYNYNLYNSLKYNIEGQLEQLNTEEELRYIQVFFCFVIFCFQMFSQNHVEIIFFAQHLGQQKNHTCTLFCEKFKQKTT